MATKTDILEEVLTQCFDFQRYMKFIREFFNSLETMKNSTEKIASTKQFIYTIDSYYYIAQYIDSQKNRIAILAVKLKSGRSVERQRSVQRNFVSKIISDAGCNAAIVAFYTEDDTKWRLSFVRLDQTWDAGKFKTTITPAKRYSYLVGEKEPCRTAKERLLPIFENEDFNPTLDKIEEAFSVDVVTDEFFKKYEKKYSELKKHFDQNEVFIKIAQENQFTSEQFAKKLMGQLVFLYFLQKKGWLGVGGLPRILNTKNYKNAYYKKHHKRVKEIVEKIYKNLNEDEYRLDITLLMSSEFSNEDAQILAKCFDNPEWGTGEKMFIRHLFEYCKKQKSKNFFNDFLQPLFYEALCIDRKGYQYYKRFNCKIPFLNGGLFDPIENYDWQMSSFDIPNELFSNRDEKGEYNSDGILDIFEQYNFTINEDEPLEREVAIDPEMLGKIFENLLEDKDRKSKGAFYTPREIVHYMCQESLIQYLINKTLIPLDDMKNFVLYGEIMKDEDMYNMNPNQKCLPKTVFEKLELIENALKNICIADPAVGSGAFLLGMLSEIIKIRTNIVAYKANQIPSNQKELRASYYETNNPYGLKSETIKNCIHAVDIEPSAVDIAKLRLWLSLVVDDDLEPTFLDKKYVNASQRDPYPLPNLDYNIMCGNSLVEEFEGIKLFDDSILHDTADKNTQKLLFRNTMNDLLDELFKLQGEFFSENESENKRNLKIKIDNYIDRIIRTKLEQDGNDANLKKYEESIKIKVKPYFLWKLEFAKVFKENGGFDVVIGNPPYVEAKKLKNVVAKLKDKYEIYSGTADLSVYFIERGNKLCAENGVLTLIVTNKFFNTGYGKLIRAYLLKQKIYLVFDFEQVEVFENVLVSSAILGIIKSSSISDEFYYKKLYKIRHNEFFSALENAKQQMGTYKQSILGDGEWSFSDTSQLNIKTKIENAGQKLLSINGIAIYRGVTTGYNPAFIINESKQKELIAADKNNEKIIKPLLQGRNIRKWIYNENNDFLIFTKQGIDIEEYPVIKDHLKGFYIELKPRESTEQRGRKQGLYKWYEIQDNTAYYSEFEKSEKIIWGLTADKWAYAYDDKKHYLPSNGYILTSEIIPIKYLLSLFNSNVLKYYFGFIGVMTAGGAYTLKHATIQQLPIVTAQKQQMITITFLVDYILFLKNNCNEYVVTFFEAILDTCVYELYFPEEIYAANKGVIEHLQDLKPINDTMPDKQKLAIINSEFERLYDPYHPVRNNVETIENVEVIRIMKRSIMK